MGPHGDQSGYSFEQGRTVPLLPSGAPIKEDDSGSTDVGGWTLDIGGIVLSMGWAPIEGDQDQLLALTAIPFSDQAYYQTLEDAPTEATLKQGSVQIWRVKVTKHQDDGQMRLASSKPSLVSAYCHDRGRVLRMQWCPVPLAAPGQVSSLAFLCNDHKVRVVLVKKPSPDNDEGIFGMSKIAYARL